MNAIVGEKRPLEWDVSNENSNDGDDEPDIFRGPQYEQVGLPSRQQEVQAFMAQSPQERWECFGCRYRNEDKTGELPRRRIDRLMKKITKSLGQMDDVALAFEIEKDFDAIRREVNEHRLPGQPKIPKWKARTIYEHFDSHHVDPQYHQYKRLKQVREIIDISAQSSIRKDTKTGHLSIDKEQLNCYKEAVKLEQQIMKQKASECAFYNDGSVLDTKTMSKGPVSLTYKPIVDLLTNGKRRK